MELRSGYKQTEVGVIPEDWGDVTLADVTTKIGSGITPTGGSTRYRDVGRPFVRSQNIGWGRLILDDIAFIDEETHEQFAGTEIMQDDVLLNITGASIGRCAIADDRIGGGNVNQHVCIIRPDRRRTLGRLIKYGLLSVAGQRQIESYQSGGNRQGLNFQQVAAIHFAAPPTLAEQSAIATALSDADSLIESLEDLIAKKRQIKQGAMQELLTGKRRLPGFSGAWEVKRLGDLAAFYKGKGLPKSAISSSGNVQCIHYGELFTQYKETISEVISRTDPFDGSFRSVTNDVLMPTSDVTPNGLAKASCIMEDDVALGGDILVIRPNSKQVFGPFLSFVIRHAKDQVLQLVTGTTVYHLYAADMKKFIFALPSLSEQSAIATVLSDMDTELDALTAKLAKARQIKQGMMLELLTGRIRLI